MLNWSETQWNEPLPIESPVVGWGGITVTGKLDPDKKSNDRLLLQEEQRKLL